MFPPNGSAARRPLLSTGSPRVGFPGLDDTMERSDSLPPSRRAWLCFAGRYHDGRLCFAPAGPARVTGGPGVGNPVSGRKCVVEGTGRPRFLGNPAVPRPCSSTPAGSATPGQTTVCRRGPRADKDGGSPRVMLSGLKRTALALAVYASPRGSPHTTQDALPAAGQALPGGIGYPQGSYERF